MEHLRIFLLIFMFSRKASLLNQTNEKLSYEKEQYKTNRTSKFLPVVELVTFENSACVSESGSIGTCFSKSDCKDHKGEYFGECAKGYGVCCVATATCDSVITMNNTYFKNPNDLSSLQKRRVCSVEIHAPKNTAQIKLEFDTFDILGPTDGDCTNDTFLVTGVDAGSTVPIICGVNSEQHMFLDVGNSNGPQKLTFSLSEVSFDRKWEIKVSFLSDYDECKAPPRCLQYFTDLSGMITSFNYFGNLPMALNNLGYAICFGTISGFCDVGLTNINIDMGESDCGTEYLASFGERICGTQENVQFQLNATGPLTLYVKTDDDNSDQQEGFRINYNFLPCSP